MNSVDTILTLAKSFVGKRAGIPEIYNTFRPRPRGYRVKLEDELCATFISVLFIKTGWTDIVPPECGAKQLYENMKALSRAITDRTRVPDPGDLIFFGSAAQGIKHVGIVSEVQNKSQIYYYDINSVVKRCTVPVGVAYIYGYGIPDYASKEKPGPTPTPTPAIQAGDLVRIKTGATWYNGATIPAALFDDQWYVIQNKNGRVVLGMNLRQTRNIQSPIHEEDVELVNGASNTATYKDLTVSITEAAYERLKMLAFETGKSMAEVIESLI